MVTTTGIHADGHVHVYPIYDVARLLATATARARRLGGPLLLFLAESEGHRFFEQSPTDLLEPTDEPISLRHGGDLVYVIAGRQVVSREGVEVLLLGLDPTRPVSKSADRHEEAASIVQAGLDAGALAVLPWGFGKWIGRRGRVVRAIAAEHRPLETGRLLVGDTLARCWPWPDPVRTAGGGRLMAGTDILPIADAERDVACYGSRIDAAFREARPGESWISAVDGGAQLTPFGCRHGIARALGDQLRLRRDSGP